MASTLESRLKEAEIALLEAKLVEQTRRNDLVKQQPVADGHFMFIGPVLETSVHKLIEDIEVWRRGHVGAPITITINSQGGVVIDGFALIDYIQRLRREGHHVKMVGLGLIASMAAVILQMGDERIMTKHSWMLIHEVQGVAEGSFSVMEDDMKFNKRLQDQALNILAERASWQRKDILRKWKRRDCWLDAEEALAAGFVDEVED
jgi:ATP-dependent protease ClpP protease subunit